jgi:hypothetical protein
VAELGQLEQRDRPFEPAAGVHDRARPPFAVRELQVDQVDGVVDVQDVANLLAAAAEADVLERPPEVVREQPVGEDALVDLAHLPRAGDHAEAVHDRREAERRRVLLDQMLGRELRRPVERARAVERERLGDTLRRQPGNRLMLGEPEARLRLLEARRAETGDGVDAARREEDELRVVLPAELEAREGAEQVRADEVVERAVDAREDGRLGGALDERVDLSHHGEVLAVAHVALDELHAGFPQARQVQLGAAPVQAVEREDLPVGVTGREPHRQVAADEAGAAGDQDPHRPDILGSGSRVRRAEDAVDRVRVRRRRRALAREAERPREMRVVLDLLHGGSDEDAVEDRAHARGDGVGNQA